VLLGTQLIRTINLGTALLLLLGTEEVLATKLLGTQLLGTVKLGTQLLSTLELGTALLGIEVLATKLLVLVAARSTDASWNSAEEAWHLAAKNNESRHCATTGNRGACNETARNTTQLLRNTEVRHSAS